MPSLIDAVGESGDKHLLLDYIWTDADGNFRSKTRVVRNPTHPSHAGLGDGQSVAKWLRWSFDGSSTGQAEGADSDVFLQPVAFYPNRLRVHSKSTNTSATSVFVLCETLQRDSTPHASNLRRACARSAAAHRGQKCWFGIEQEYAVFELSCERLPLGWKKIPVHPADTERFGLDRRCLFTVHPGRGNPADANVYYCGVGGDRAFGRAISERHLELCLSAGLSICGTNLEVVPSQLEYQIGPLPPLELADELMLSRYLLLLVSEEFACRVSFEPTPFIHVRGPGKQDPANPRALNGSGGHCNFSDAASRRRGSGLAHLHSLCGKLAEHSQALLAVCGAGNEARMTGANETASLTEFTVGEGNRGASVRIPYGVLDAGCGYLEYRVPAANVNPYCITRAMMDACYGTKESDPDAESDPDSDSDTNSKRACTLCVPY